MGRCEQSLCFVNLVVYQIENFDTTSARMHYESSGSMPSAGNLLSIHCILFFPSPLSIAACAAHMSVFNRAILVLLFCCFRPRRNKSLPSLRPEVLVRCGIFSNRWVAEIERRRQCQFVRYA